MKRQNLAEKRREKNIYVAEKIIVCYNVVTLILEDRFYGIVEKPD